MPVSTTIIQNRGVRTPAPWLVMFGCSIAPRPDGMRCLSSGCGRRMRSLTLAARRSRTALSQRGGPGRRSLPPGPVMRVAPGRSHLSPPYTDSKARSHPPGRQVLLVRLAQASFLRLLRRPSSRYSGQNPLIAVAAMTAAKIRATTPPAVPAPTRSRARPRPLNEDGRRWA